MRKEFVRYLLDIPVNVTFVTITEYPFHWHNSMEILFVLNGSVKVSIESETYVLCEKELEIININEAHRIFSNDKNNKVLIFHFQPEFFAKYYTDIENMVFYTEDNQVSDEYKELRELLSIIICELIQKNEDYDEEIENTAVDLLYHLINNFHYLMYEKEVDENEELLQRYHRIAKYIYNNYNNKISLQDIAEKEFLSTHYLSHEIKYAMGYNFTDLINLTRVEESIKLLLDSDKNISEISEEIGFSHIRYYNKHFKIHFKATPMQFRKKFKFNDGDLEDNKNIICHDIKESLGYIVNYLQGYARFNFENKIVKININMENDLGEMDNSFKSIIDLGDAFDLLIEDNKDILEEIQEEISFSYGRLLNLFSPDMGIFPSAEFCNWNRAKTVFEYLDYIGLKPLIVLDSNDFIEGEFIRILTSFIEYFNNIDALKLLEFKFQFSSNFNECFISKVKEILYENDLQVCEECMNTCSNIDLIYDTAYMLPFIIHNVISKKINLDFLRAFDVLEKQVNLTNEVFFGYPGFVNDMGIRKPSYYAYYLLSKLGDIIVCKDDGYIVTKSEDEYAILLYNYNEELDKLLSFEDFSKMRRLKNNIGKKVSLNIINIDSNSRMIFYDISEMVGSSYNYWLEMGKPIRLSKEEKEILYKASFPKIHFSYSKKSTVLNIVKEVKNYGASLILIKKISKHLK